jgi:hypothetical protein
LMSLVKYAVMTKRSAGLSPPTTTHT